MPVAADYLIAKKAAEDEDFKRAFKDWRLSAQQGYPEAQNALANSYFHGIGTPQDYREALKWYEKVPRQNDPEALQNMGYIYANGLGGVGKNLKKAFSLYLKAAQQGHVGGQYFVGQFYARGLGVEKDNVKALMWFDLVVSQSRVPFNEFQSAGADALFFVNRLKSKMAPDEILMARKLRKEWQPSEQ
ncbi:MAG: tetratricopeptide repeat protein [Nitrospinales bacterium]